MLNIEEFELESIFIFSFNRLHEKFTRIHEKYMKTHKNSLVIVFFHANAIKTLLPMKKKEMEYFINGTLAHCGHNFGHNNSKLKNSS